MEYENTIKLTIEVTADTIEDANSKISKLANKISASNKHITNSDVCLDSTTPLDKMGNKLVQFFNADKMKRDFYIPMCPYGVTDCIHDKNYSNRAKKKPNTRFSGKPCKGCVNMSEYDDEDK